MRHSSGNISTTLEMLPGLEGFQLETYGRVDKQTTTHAHSDTRTSRCYDPSKFHVFTQSSVSFHLSRCRDAQFLYPTNAREAEAAISQ
ncbi:CDK5 and ABL1 enzyme substrate 2-like protein [Lates japonicus]|uniref:CDK5 and ABL1 enzyme substrate 2-like protein n=1 Tax=Lates japonicus TaxID=270547 RepID=A0AAD3MBQ0_LATJO|nr:CDK5 and ABL1 enzyme substrate 2-like protein [Lates japonicus]